MREVFVIRAVTRVGDDLACGRIHSLCRNSGFGCGQCGRLRAMHDLKHLVHLLGGLAHYEGAADVRLITFHRASPIH